MLIIHFLKFKIMKEHPILFSAPMVRAILEGRKTQTRRIMKPQPQFLTGRGKRVYANCDFKKSWEDISGTGEGSGLSDCPFGDVSDRLWVRETFAEIGCIGWPIDKFEYAYRSDFAHNNGKWEGYADMCFEKWKPSIFMPRKASRITLEIADIRCERLNDISESEAIAEGIEPIIGQDGETYYGNYGKEDIGHLLTPVESYRSLWQSINGPESWENNPYVWVISFVRL